MYHQPGIELSCGGPTNHVFSASHEPLVDDFRGIVSPRVDVYTLLDD